MQYKFPKAVGDIRLNDRLSLFVEIAMEYEKTLDFKYRLNYFDYEEDETKKHKKLGYTVILPVAEGKKKEKKAA